MPGPEDEWDLTAADAARRLGVKKETLYAYVSRGLLESRRLPGTRESRFDPASVARLAARRRSGGRAGALELVVDTELTLLDPCGGLWFRGWDATRACSEAAFEDVAEWLWGTGASGQPFRPEPAALAAARRALTVLPASARPVDGFHLALAAAAAGDALRDDRRPEAVAATGRRVIGLLAATLPSSAGRADDGGASVARRVLLGLRPGAAATDAEVHAINAALVLLADHEMASSTLAARVAASTWANPYLVVTAGLAVLAGALHGAAADRLLPLLDDAAERGAAAAVGERMRDGLPVGGFGHLVYRRGDPRADALWPLLAAAWPDHPALQVAEDLVSVMTAHGDTFPNIDLALATLVRCARLGRGSAEAIFAVARTAGWLAHALEEYGHRLRFRARAAYTGPAPLAPPGPV